MVILVARVHMPSCCPSLVLKPNVEMMLQIIDSLTCLGNA